MKTIETKKAASGRHTLTVDGKRTALERLAKEVSENPFDFTIVGALGSFTFTQKTAVKGYCEYDIREYIYTFTNEDGAIVSTTLNFGTVEKAEFIAYREAIKFICDIPYGIAKFTPAPEIDASEYAVTADAQDVAIDAEIALAADKEKTAEFKYYLKSRRPIYGSVPTGYISSTVGEMKVHSLRSDGSISPVPRTVVFGVVVYDHALTDEQIINFDLHVDPRNPSPDIENKVELDAQIALANADLPTGNITVSNGIDAFNLVGKYFPNGLNFVGNSKGFNREDEFTFNDGSNLFVTVSCSKDNSRVEALRVIDTNESGSKRHLLNVYIKKIEIVPETDGSEEDDDDQDFIAVNSAEDENISEETVQQQCDCINQHAPADWQITFNGKTFPVKFKNKIVTTLDSLATAKLLPPDKFFAQFKPLVNKSYSIKQQFLDDRYRELDNLIQMREEISDDAERLKTLDELIEITKRAIAETEFCAPSNKRHDAVDLDANGNITDIWF